MEKISYERRIYESLDDIRDYLRLYLENRRKIKFTKQRVKFILFKCCPKFILFKWGRMFCGFKEEELIAPLPLLECTGSQSVKNATQLNKNLIPLQQ